MKAIATKDALIKPLRFGTSCYLLLAAMICGNLSLGFAQNIQLAQNYLDQGAYAKAESIFKQLYQSDKRTSSYFEGYINALQAQEKYEDAQKVLLEFSKNIPNYPGIEVRIGQNYALQQKEEQAHSHYEKALEQVKRQPGFAYGTGKTFREYSLLEYAIRSYTIGLDQTGDPTYAIQLAQIYGEQGKLEKMFNTFLELVEKDTQYFYSINRYLSQYITSDPNHAANNTLRRQLLKNLQENPNLVYNRLLSWLFTQENNFKQAFVQEKAIYQRSENKNLSRIVEMAALAAEKNQFVVATEMLQFNLEKQTSLGSKMLAHSKLFKVQIQKAAPQDYPQIDKDFIRSIELYKTAGGSPFILRIQYAEFLALKMDRKEDALALLQKELKTDLSDQQEAKAKMLAADILVTKERFNQALVYYTQVKSLVNNTPLAQEALFKIAKTSFYKGDFDWAQTQLNILKKATTELTANDAIALNLLIQENRNSDSTQTALKLLAKAELLTLQEQYRQALPLLDSILCQWGGNIKETALIRRAHLHENMGAYQKAITTYTELIQSFPHSIYMDDALYALAELYRTKQEDKEKAMAYYKQIIFEHADSIFFVEARKKYRQLRGDTVL